MKKQITYILLAISLVASIAYLIYAFVGGDSIVANLNNIISALILFVFSFVFFIFGVKTVIKKENIPISLGAILLIMFIMYSLLGSLNIINFPFTRTVGNFVSQDITNALKWAKANDITVEQTYETSDIYDEFHIISQDIQEGTSLGSVDTISFVISSGPNYDKLIIVPSMLGWTIDQVKEFINENHMINVNINFVYSDETKDIVIEQDKSGQLRRNDSLTITFSLGKEGELQPVELINFTNTSLFDTTMWLKRYGINYTLSYDYSDTIKRNNIVSQSVEAGKTVNPKTDIGLIITVSKGNQIIVPDLLNMNMDAITKWISDNKLKVSFSDRYDEATIGKIIETNYKKDDVIQEGTLITIVLSKGQLKMPDYDTLSEYREWADKYNVQMDEQYEFSNSISNGHIIRLFPQPNTVIDLNDKVVITVSQGKPVTIPSFVGKTKSQATSSCTSVNLKCTFVYGSYSSSVAKDVVTSQSKKSSAQVLQGSSITLTLSKGTAHSYEFSYLEDWVRSGVADTTISFLRNKFATIYPGVSFTFVKVDHNTLPSGYIHPSSPTNIGSTIEQGRTYTVWVVK